MCAEGREYCIGSHTDVGTVSFLGAIYHRVRGLSEKVLVHHGAPQGLFSLFLDLFRRHKQFDFEFSHLEPHDIVAAEYEVTFFLQGKDNDKL